LTRSMPISISLPQQATASGAFAKYADPEKRKLENGAFALSMKAKHENAR